MSISENIKRLREAHGMSQAEFGRIAGVSDKAVSTWENGLKTPRMGAVQKLSDYFAIPKSDILDDPAAPAAPAAPPIDFDAFTYAMHNETKDLPQEKKDMLLQMARFFNEELRKEQ